MKMGSNNKKSHQRLSSQLFNFRIFAQISLGLVYEIRLRGWLFFGHLDALDTSRSMLSDAKGHVCTDNKCATRVDSC